MVNLLDPVHTQGRGVHALQFDSDDELTATAATGGGYYAVLSTNRGTVDCDMGTMAFKSDGSVIKWLTSTGWQTFA